MYMNNWSNNIIIIILQVFQVFLGMLYFKFYKFIPDYIKYFTNEKIKQSPQTSKKRFYNNN